MSSVRESLDRAADIAQRVIAEADRLEGRELLEAAPVVRDLTYLLLKLRPEESTARGRFAGRAAALAFSRSDLAMALGDRGEWRTRRELCALLCCSGQSLVKWWEEYSAADPRFESKRGGGRSKPTLYRLRQGGGA